MHAICASIIEYNRHVWCGAVTAVYVCVFLKENLCESVYIVVTIVHAPKYCILKQFFCASCAICTWFNKPTDDYSQFFACRPKTDTCKTCDSLKVQIEAEEDETNLAQLKGKKELHLCMAERSYQQLKEDSALAKSNSDVLTIIFDLQQSLPTPVLSTNVVFYKRQLWTYNVGIHNRGAETGHMHVLHEGVASRGSQKVKAYFSNF